MGAALVPSLVWLKVRCIHDYFLLGKTGLNIPIACLTEILWILSYDTLVSKLIC